jgi:GT2 family glycosyltransferase
MSGRVSAVIATRDRGAEVARAVQSILATDPPVLEVIVVDQSSDDATEAALQPLRADVHYRRLARPGLSRARNAGIAEVVGEFVAITDDDCEVPPDWTQRVIDALESDERIAIVFGNVVPAAFDAAAGFIPGYVRTDAFLADAPGKKAAIDGIGACMALRRSAWDALGGFDEMLGPGSAFPGGDEGDFALRALAAGWYVLETPQLWVEHHGFRTRAQARDFIGIYARGTGAMMAKHVRCRTPHARRLLGSMALRWSRGGVHQTAATGDSRHRLWRLQAFATGFAEGTRAPLDRSAVLFKPDNAQGRVPT